MPTPLPPKYPLVQYLKIEGNYGLRIKRVLEQAAADTEARILKLNPSGNPLTRAQLEATRSAINSQLAGHWSEIQNNIALGQRAAAAEAVKTLGAYEKNFLEAFGSADYMDDIIAGEAQRAANGINTLMQRYTSSYKPLSERVYGARNIGMGSIDKAINAALVSSLSAAQFAKSIRDLISPSVPGGVSYAAMRTARTEINNAHHAATQQRYRDSKIVESVDWHLSTSHPEGDLCDSLVADSPYKVDEVPEKPHPQCLCYTTPGLPDRKEFLDRLLRGDYGDEPWEMGAKTSEGAAEHAAKPKGTGKPSMSTMLKSGTPSSADMAKVYNGKYGALELKVDEAYSYGRGNVNVDMTIFSGAGERVGKVERVFTTLDNGDLIVKHELMEIDRAYRGKGFSTAFSDFSEQWYKESGVSRIKIHAALSDGGYTWGRAGYTWDPTEYRAPKPAAPAAEGVIQLSGSFGGEYPQTVLRALKSGNLSDNDKIIARAVEARFAGPFDEWPSPSEIAALTGDDPQLGKTILSGTNWYGVKVL